MIKFLLDDMREIPVDIVCRNFDAATLVKGNIFWGDAVLFLDHDLADTETPERTGLTFLRNLFEDENFPAEIVIVTSNPVGHKNIIAEIEASGVYEPIDFQRREWRCTFYGALDTEPFQVDIDEGDH